MLTKLTDVAIEDARKKAHTRLREFLAHEGPQRDVARLAHSIHSAICTFERIHRRVSIRTDDTRWQPLPNPMAARAALERLLSQSDYVRAKAFKELPPVAMDVLAVAAERVTGEPLSKMMKRWPFSQDSPNVLMHVPTWTDIMRMLPTALELCARDNTSRATRKIERDAAVIAILRAYQTIHGEPPTVQNARPFVEKIERLYKPLLPVKGFNVARSAKVLQGLIAAAA